MAAIMISYTLYQKNPASHYVYIDLEFDVLNEEQIELQLPAWRPGRYELGNFAKNIKRVDVYGQNGEALPYLKTGKDRWQISCKGHKALKVTYSYYAAELNAGSCFADQSQVYINPVHCCMYLPARMNEAHRLILKVPEHYRIASSLKRDGQALTEASFDELADSPVIASSRLQSDEYSCDGIRFYIHVNGICRPDFEKLKKDFTAFTKSNIAFWGDFPFGEYHFLIQVLPLKFYHGVEHLRSTVIAIGPGYEFNKGITYDELLGVSCHELFHVWNIKTIRPAEMLPYDFTKENFARSGYVYEGFTTYYGDKLLHCSGLFDQQKYFRTFEERILKHLHNYGRYNLSVAQSSWDTWLDGYVPGAPYRKTNIYDEGCLVAFMLDVLILKHSGNARSLRDLCIALYEKFGKKQIGYTEEDVMRLASDCSGTNLSDFFQKTVYGTGGYEEQLLPCLGYLGWELELRPSPLISEDRYGFKCIDSGFFSKVSLVAPYSPAWKAGLFAGDEIIAVNAVALRNNLNAWLGYFEAEQELILTVNSGEELKQVRLGADKNNTRYFPIPVLSQKQGISKAELENQKAWLRIA